MKLEFSAGGVIFRRIENQIEFLIIKDSYDKWTFPKGHIEKGEKPDEAAIREVGEEVGLTDIKIVNLLSKIDYWFKFEGELIHKFVYFYLMESYSFDLKIQEEEIKEAKWVNVKETINTLSYKDENTTLIHKAMLELEKGEKNER